MKPVTTTKEKPVQREDAEGAEKTSLRLSASSLCALCGYPLPRTLDWTFFLIPASSSIGFAGVPGPDIPGVGLRIGNLCKGGFEILPADRLFEPLEQVR